jgi:hypothetical protein
LLQIGERLGLIANEQTYGNLTSITWQDNPGEIIFKFFPTVTANVGEILIQNSNFSGKSFIVLPGSRTSLILYKFRRDPRLRRAFDPSSGNWQFLKFRHVKSLVENPGLNRENLDQMLRLDPLTFSAPQLRFI